MKSANISLNVDFLPIFRNCPIFLKIGQISSGQSDPQNTLFRVTDSSQSWYRFLGVFLLNLGGTLPNIGKVARFLQYLIGGSAVLDIFKMSKMDFGPSEKMQKTCNCAAPLPTLGGKAEKKLIFYVGAYFLQKKTA